jgi:hypothetical protein
VTVSSSSTAGRSASSPNGTWSSTISLPVTPGSTSTTSFYYQDTRAGSPTLTANAPGYNSGAQAETITAAGLATITITPNSIQTRVGANVALQASGADAYGNPVPVSPSWSVTPQIGSFTPSSGTRTTFTATAAGTGTITAAAGTTTASVPLTVARKRH